MSNLTALWWICNCWAKKINASRYLRKIRNIVYWTIIQHLSLLGNNEVNDESIYQNRKSVEIILQNITAKNLKLK